MTDSGFSSLWKGSEKKGQRITLEHRVPRHELHYLGYLGLRAELALGH